MTAPPTGPTGLTGLTGLTVLMTADTVGGVFSYAAALARGLADGGVRVVLATMGAPVTPDQRAQLDGVPGLMLEQSGYALEWQPDCADDLDRCGAWLLALEAAHRPDIVHLNGYCFGALPFRAPSVIVAHSDVASWWRAVHNAPAPATWDAYRERVQRGVSRAARVIAPTCSMLRALDREYGAIAHGAVVYNGLDPVTAPATPKRPQVFAAGRVWDEAKNLATLDRAAALIGWPVEIAGATAQPGCAPIAFAAARTLGRLEPPELRARLAAAAIYAAPALYEPFGLAILEAAGAACALVLGDIASLRELWDGAASFAPPRDSRAFAAAIQSLIDNPGERARLARAAVGRALHYGAARMTAAYRTHYRDLLAMAAPVAMGCGR